MAPREEKPRLSRLESAVMQVVWSKAAVTAEEVRQALSRKQRLKESTVRTILRRLEDKGYAEHDVKGRTYVYRPRIEPQSVAAQQVRGIIDRFCQGSIESLLVGMVDDNLITTDQLCELAERIAEAEANANSKRKRGTEK